MNTGLHIIITELILSKSSKITIHYVYQCQTTHYVLIDDDKRNDTVICLMVHAKARPSGMFISGPGSLFID